MPFLMKVDVDSLNRLFQGGRCLMVNKQLQSSYDAVIDRIEIDWDYDQDKKTLEQSVLIVHFKSGVARSPHGEIELPSPGYDKLSLTAKDYPGPTLDASGTKVLFYKADFSVEVELLPRITQVLSRSSLGSQKSEGEVADEGAHKEKHDAKDGGSSKSSRLSRISPKPSGEGSPGTPRFATSS